jgi:hypothetical protein
VGGLLQCNFVGRLLAVAALVPFSVMPLVAKGAEARDEGNGLRSLDAELRAVKQEVLEINQELLDLEEAVLYPPDEQLVVFVALSAESESELDTVQIKLDGRVVAEHKYHADELDALRNGGAQRLHVARLPRGVHTLVASLTGLSATGERYRRDISATIVKGLGPKYLELRLAQEGDRGESEVTVRQW